MIRGDDMSEILVVGSVAYDTISTPKGKTEQTLGGSANYFSCAASLYSDINVVGVVGDDYAESDLELLRSKNVNLDGLQQVSGKTFHWEGKYEDDMNEAITIDTQLNVFEQFDPTLPESYKSSEYVFLANIHPDLQIKVLDQIDEPKFVGADTMNFWISSQKDRLKDVLKRIDVLLINEGEARDLTGEWNAVKAAKLITDMGPKGVVIKRGEYGFMMYSEEQYFMLPAFPVENVVDPTGAGDTFAGGFFGYLSKTKEGFNFGHLKQACMQGCLMASFTVQDFGLGAIRSVQWADLEKRQAEYYKVISYLD
jgi:sugar/nucleoside kinase (ribokinase family)